MRAGFCPPDIALLERFMIDCLKASDLADEGHRIVARYPIEERVGLVTLVPLTGSYSATESLHVACCMTRATKAPSSVCRRTLSPAATASSRAIIRAPSSVCTLPIVTGEPSSRPAARRTVVTCSTTPVLTTTSRVSKLPQRGHQYRCGNPRQPQASQPQILTPFTSPSREQRRSHTPHSDTRPSRSRTRPRSALRQSDVRLRHPEAGSQVRRARASHQLLRPVQPRAAHLRY